jgi:hypothetical protein
MHVSYLRRVWRRRFENGDSTHPNRWVHGRRRHTLTPARRRRCPREPLSSPAGFHAVGARLEDARRTDTFGGSPRMDRGQGLSGEYLFMSVVTLLIVRHNSKQEIFI